MSFEAVARRYAQALLELGEEGGGVEPLQRDVSAFAEAFRASAELRDALQNPLVTDEQRAAILEELARRLGAGEPSRNAVLLLARRRRLPALPAIAGELRRLWDERAGVLRATVTSAAPLAEGYLERLRGELERATGKKVIVTHLIDPSLLAGVVTRVGDRVIDGSMRAKLAGLRASLLAG